MYDHDKCKTCKYSTKLNDSEVCCVYILMKNHMRGSYTGAECDKYIKRTRRRKATITDGGFTYDNE